MSPVESGRRCPECFNVVLPSRPTLRCRCGVTLRAPTAARRAKCPRCGAVHQAPELAWVCACGCVVGESPEVTPTRAHSGMRSHEAGQLRSDPEPRTTSASAPPRRTPLPPHPVNSGPGVCPCGCGRSLGFRRGAGKGYRWAHDATARMDSVRLRFSAYLAESPELEEATLSVIAYGCRICGWWLDHCHRTATPLATPHMMQLMDETGKLMRLADRVEVEGPVVWRSV
jgi:hypothetical protein